MAKCDRCGEEISFLSMNTSCEVMNFYPVCGVPHNTEKILCIKCGDKFNKYMEKCYDKFFKPEKENKMDNQLFIKTLKDIQELCKSTSNCQKGCPFFINEPQSYVGCWFVQISDIPRFPMLWNFNQLEEKENKMNDINNLLLKKNIKEFNVLRFIADNAGLSLPEAIEKAYNLGRQDVLCVTH